MPGIRWPASNAISRMILKVGWISLTAMRSFFVFRHRARSKDEEKLLVRLTAIGMDADADDRANPKTKRPVSLSIPAF